MMAAVRGGKAWKSFIRVSGFPSDNIFFSPPPRPPAPYHLIICLLFSPALFLLAPTFRNLIKINVNYGWEGKKRTGRGERKLSYVSNTRELKVTLWPTLIFRKHEQTLMLPSVVMNPAAACSKFWQDSAFRMRVRVSCTKKLLHASSSSERLPEHKKSSLSV